MNKFLVFIFFLLGFQCNQTIKVDYYLPENFEGEVAIIHSIKAGITPTSKDDRLQIIIPDSGIVLLTNEYKSGKIDYRYFIKAGNEYSRLYPDNFDTGTASRTKRIFFQRVMTFDFPYKGRMEDSVSYVGELFYVGKSLDATADKKRFLFERHVSEMLDDKK